MKKTAKIAIALLLAAEILFSLCVFSFAASTRAPAAVTGLQITTAGKAKQLKLSWSQQQADGVQIFRSTTGKADSYRRIATVRNKTSYVDKDLKASTIYYYKVRAFKKANNKNVYSSFRAVSLSTRITASYVKKRFNATIKFLADFYEKGTDFNHMILRTHTDQYGTYEDPHYLFNYKGCNTKAKLIKFLSKYFTEKVAKTIVNNKFYVIDGKLYIWFPVMGAEEWMVLNQTKITKLKLSDQKATFSVGIYWDCPEGYGNPSYDYCNQALVFENNRWVFGKTAYMNDWMYPYE